MPLLLRAVILVIAAVSDNAINNITMLIMILTNNVKHKQLRCPLYHTYILEYWNKCISWREADRLNCSDTHSTCLQSIYILDMSG